MGTRCRKELPCTVNLRRWFKNVGSRGGLLENLEPAGGVVGFTEKSMARAAMGRYVHRTVKKKCETEPVTLEWEMLVHPDEFCIYAAHGAEAKGVTYNKFTFARCPARVEAGGATVVARRWAGVFMVVPKLRAEVLGELHLETHSSKWG